MGKIDQLYKALAADPDPETDRILAAALPQAEPAYAARIASILLRRERETSWAGLVAHYDRLTLDVQVQVRARPELLQAGMAAALGSSVPGARANALALLAEHPCPKLGYALVDCLRDTSPRNRGAAAAALRRCALFVADGGGGDAQAASAAAGERAALLQALRDALRTFGLHRHTEVVEAALWFARELGESLWEALADQRARLGHVVEEHLGEWDHARLAGFLLRALARPAWRQAALGLLRNWREPGQLAAILRNSDVLRVPQIREHLHYLRRPRWLTACAPDLSDLAAAERAQLPHWICHLGLSDEERLALLARWHASRYPEVRRAAVYALAALELPQTPEILAQIVRGGDAVACFARWFLGGQKARAIGDAIWKSRRAQPLQRQQAARPQAVRGAVR